VRRRLAPGITRGGGRHRSAPANGGDEGKVPEGASNRLKVTLVSAGPTGGAFCLL
jgi:hypothetical protein